MNLWQFSCIIIFVFTRWPLGLAGGFFNAQIREIVCIAKTVYTALRATEPVRIPRFFEKQCNRMRRLAMVGLRGRMLKTLGK